MQASINNSGNTTTIKDTYNKRSGLLFGFELSVGAILCRHGNFVGVGVFCPPGRKRGRRSKCLHVCAPAMFGLCLLAAFSSACGFGANLPDVGFLLSC